MRNKHSLPADAVLLLGPTGAGKSPLGDQIARRRFLGRTAHHFDFGFELRSIAAGGEASADYSPEEMAFVRGVLDQGLLLENEHFRLAEKIVLLFFERRGFRQGDVLVLNGLPRHAGQAADIDQLARVHSLIVLDCTAADIFCRIEENVGGDRSGRVDDGKNLVEKKLRIFRERTAPLIEHYAAKGSKIYRIAISGTTTPDEACRTLLSLASADPPVALVAEPPQG
jgi:adenylate kinase family enzyme